MGCLPTQGTRATGYLSATAPAGESARRRDASRSAGRQRPCRIFPGALRRQRAEVLLGEAGIGIDQVHWQRLRLPLRQKVQQLALFVNLASWRAWWKTCGARQTREPLRRPRGKIASLGRRDQLTGTTVAETLVRCIRSGNTGSYRLESGTRQMNSLFSFGTETGVGFQVAWEDGDRVVGRGWLLGPEGEPKAMLAVWPAAEHPPPLPSLASHTNTA